MALPKTDSELSFSFGDVDGEKRRSRVLVLYAGGTIGMKKTSNGTKSIKIIPRDVPVINGMEEDFEFLLEQILLSRIKVLKTFRISYRRKLYSTERTGGKLVA